jgi:YHS domain-containing protein
MWMFSKKLLVSLAFAVTTIASLAQAEQINTNDANIAIEGYDPVAYFTEARAVEGLPDFQTAWQGVTWQFSSMEHQAMFEGSPEKYAPRYGGFCAGSMSAKGVKAKVDPNMWKIIDGNLFLGADQRIDTFFEEDAEVKIERADENWKAMN